MVAVYLAGLGIDVMEVDAAQYASISMEMLQGGNWLQVQHRGADYLDKPPLLFWLSAVSFALFGLSNWAYKLPSVLAALLGVWSVYCFARLYYAAPTARWAAFILAASLGLMLICNDVRTDTLLLGFSACAVWQIAEYLESRRWRNLFLGFGAIGLAMLAKGPIGLVAPAFAVGGHLLLCGRWREVLRWEWLLGLIVVALLLAPMCWGLWQQFDLHPEKWVNGRQGVSGLRFFFWEQSFGRITGENVWKNDASAFFFLHVYLWAFLPWSLLLPWALVRAISATWTSWRFEKKASWPEYYSLAGFVLTFIALSLSRYKLPHYIFITLPWASVLVASALERGVGALPRWLFGIGAVAGLLLGWVIVLWAFPTASLFVWVPLGVGTLAWLWAFVRSARALSAEGLTRLGVAAACLLGFVLNVHFYPQLLPYQYSRRAVAAAREAGLSADALCFFQMNHHSLDFYNGRIVPRHDDPADVIKLAVQKGGPVGVFTTPTGKAALEQAGIPIEQAIELKHFHVAMLHARFLNPATRQGALQTLYFLKIHSPDAR
ncbi:MAG: glycosyltransferase family 39 protein [Saprospiraceae bacterium]|nr:glycosyltransferase family 39 protein [Saprospiraceae bacterium]MDW8228791.1 glycosyltransferase family 39 protein [Saprospiraceae bacterium]